MTGMAVSTPRRAGNREALLEAALRCLQERGYARTTARDLVAESGTNLGAIGYHFGSKDGLLNQALAEGFRRWFAEFATLAVEPGPASPEERLRRMTAELEGSFARNRGLGVAFVEALAQVERSEDVRRELAQSYEDIRNALGGLIAATLAGEGRPEVDGRALAAQMVASFDGLLIQWLIDSRRTPKGSEILAALEAVIGDRPRR
jgi:AcrR family transcriptional regulator